MHICIAISTIDKKGGGPSRSVPILAKGLDSIGVKITLLFLESDDMNNHLLEGTGVNMRILPKKNYKKVLELIIREGQFDLIHLQNLWIPFYHKIASIARKYNIPYMMTPRGTLEPWCLQQKKIKKLLALSLYQKRDLNKSKCILATADMEATSIRNLGINAPIAIIPNGIDVSEYKCRPTEFVSNVKKQILFLSRIHPKKGIEILIDVWDKIKSKYPDWNIIIAGNGEEDYIQRLKNLLILKKMSSIINIIPPVFGENKHKLYCESSLFVLPTYSENFGMVIAEAMSCGVPVITTTGTPWEELNEKKLGWCIDLSEVNLQNTLEEAMKLGADVLFDMGQRSSKHIIETYQYTEVAKKNKMVYEWIILGKEKPSFVI